MRFIIIDKLKATAKYLCCRDRLSEWVSAVRGEGWLRNALGKWWSRFDLVAARHCLRASFLALPFKKSKSHISTMKCCRSKEGKRTPVSSPRCYLSLSFFLSCVSIFDFALAAAKDVVVVWNNQSRPSSVSAPVYFFIFCLPVWSNFSSKQRQVKKSCPTFLFSHKWDFAWDSFTGIAQTFAFISFASFLPLSWQMTYACLETSSPLAHAFF